MSTKASLFNRLDSAPGEGAVPVTTYAADGMQSTPRHLKLDALLEQTVSAHQAMITPSSALTTQLRCVGVNHDGSTTLNFRDTNRTFFSNIGIPLIAAIMQDPTNFLDPQLPADTNTTASPSLLHLLIFAPEDTANEDVVRLCNLIPVCKSPLIAPGREGSAQGIGSNTAPEGPSAGVIRCIGLDGCEHVSLEGGRALRDAARRNIYLRAVYDYGCSINPGTKSQLARAISANNEHTSDPVARVNHSSATQPSVLVDTTVLSDGTPRPTSFHVSTRSSSTRSGSAARENSLVRDLLSGSHKAMSTRCSEHHLTPFPLLRAVLTQQQP